MKISIDGNIGVGKSYYLRRLATEGYLVHLAPSTTKFRTGSLAYHLQMLQPLLETSSIDFASRNLETSQGGDLRPPSTTPNGGRGSEGERSPPYETESGDQIHLYERSPYTLQLIHTNIIDLDELPLYQQVVQRVNWTPDVIIYLFCHPTICHQRSLRQGGTQFSLEDLQGLHYRYETILNDLNCPVPIYKVNAQEEPEQVLANLKDILRTFVKKI
jgi:hypothetical protein